MGKLRINQLASQLNKGLAPVYLISGDETLLLEESSDAIRRHALSLGFSERERYDVDKQFDWNRLLIASNTLSLFGEKKIIELRIANGKPGDKGSRAICDYLEAPSENNCLLIITAKLDSGTQRSKWLKTVEKIGCWLPIWSVNSEQFPHFIEERLRSARLTADSQAIELLAMRTEGNLLAANQEIEKLKLLSEEGRISLELVSTTVADSARYNIFDLVDRALQGDTRAAIRNLQGLKSEGTDATIVLWGLAREIRTLLSINAKIAQGQNLSQAARQSNVWDKRLVLVGSTLKRLSVKQLERLLRQANAIDKAIKGLRKADPWGELQELVIVLSGRNSLSLKNFRLSLQSD
ncbi:MAG: DNA polymerase-3 subunit delta [Cellvibrionaceae bacterium]|jgi:DNA polymerase-3 subunit delta